MSIYKACDIRGQAATELSPALYRSWGRSLARQLGAGRTVVAGGDVRASTPGFLEALTQGLQDGGAQVIAVGQLPTPMIYFARRHFQADGCAIVTASHNPWTVNGLKWMIGDRPPTPNEVAALERTTREPLPAPGPAEASGGTGTTSRMDPAPAYLAWLHETFRHASAARLKVVLDPMHGCWAGKGGLILGQVFPHCTFTSLRDVPDPQFGGTTPDPSQAAQLTELRKAVLEQQADLGLAFDGDGDRAGLVDNEGVALRPEEATWLLLQSFGPALSGSGFVYDLKFSDRVPEAARKLGAEPLVERSGHAFLRNRMCEMGSLFGAEISGHYFYQALGGGDDALYTACRTIAFLASSTATLAALRAQCPPVHISPDLRISLPPDRQPEVIARIRNAWKEHPQTTLDGVRIDTPEGWILVRSSVTEPALTFRFEGTSQAALDGLVDRFADSMPELGPRLKEAFARVSRRVAPAPERHRPK